MIAKTKKSGPNNAAAEARVELKTPKVEAHPRQSAQSAFKSNTVRFKANNVPITQSMPLNSVFGSMAPSTKQTPPWIQTIGTRLGRYAARPNEFVKITGSDEATLKKLKESSQKTVKVSIVPKHFDRIEVAILNPYQKFI